MPIVANDVNSPEEFAEIGEEVKEGILEVLNATLIPVGAPVAGEKLPKIKNRRIIDRVPEKYGPKLESERHKAGTAPDETKKIHIFMVGYSGIDTNVDGNSVGRKNFRLKFYIDSYYEDDIGTDEDNAEKRHAKEIAMVTYALFASRVLNRPGIVERVLDFDEHRGFARVGERQVRESLGELFVKIKAVQI